MLSDGLIFRLVKRGPSSRHLFISLRRLGMKRLILMAVVFGLLGIPMQSAFPVNSVKYSNQKAGSTCKKSEFNKFVVLPDRSILICVSSAKKYIWKRPSTTPASTPAPTPTAKPIPKVIAFGMWGETNFGRFSLLKSFSLASVGLEKDLGAGTVYLIKGCLQTWQPPNPIGFSFSESSWSAIDANGKRVTVGTVFGPAALAPTYPSVYSDQILQPGDCISGHVVFFSSSQIVELLYIDSTLGGLIRFSAS
jgi:hypothetical protein